MQVQSENSEDRFRMLRWKLMVRVFVGHDASFLVRVFIGGNSNDVILLISVFDTTSVPTIDRSECHFRERDVNFQTKGYLGSISFPGHFPKEIHG